MSRVQELNKEMNALAEASLKDKILPCLTDLMIELDNTDGGDMAGLTGNLKAVIIAYQKQADTFLKKQEAEAADEILDSV